MIKYRALLILLLPLAEWVFCITPDAQLIKSITKHDLPVELHKVVTADDYVLTMIRIPAPGKPPLLLMHGLLCSSADYTILGPEKSLASLAYKAGYDVWLGNNRGNTFSRVHKKLDVKSKEFWEFSFDEFALYDLPSMVDYVLNRTRQTKLHYVGFSQGTTQFFAMNSLRPEYNAKFISAHLLAPVSFLHRATNPAMFLASRINELEVIADMTNVYDIASRGGPLVDTIVLAVKTGFVPPDLVLINIWYFFGYHDSINRTMIPELAEYTPAGISLYQFLHYLQVYNAKSFQRYDFGKKKNLKRYGQVNPPDYPLHKVAAPVYLYHSEKDNLNHPKDVEELVKRLPNVKLKFKVPMADWNHLDFIYSSEAHRLYQVIISELKKLRAKQLGG
ncbi:lipase 3-like [Toxorhynchites rutilus septentrionalis]|uniref:lipase 3-like n=1 Tax=Toxorhynchites rutilus septentrionalis TaxID=329112 RepID=UPI002478D9E3|nr:lipase 3-like [Toxorhynchites rutilus septentrionalis]